MKTEEFNLSKRIKFGMHPTKCVFLEDDVKEFIRLLKESLIDLWGEDNGSVNNRIDNLAGEKLK